MRRKGADAANGGDAAKGADAAKGLTAGTPMEQFHLVKVVSGGQTGADQAALRAAERCGFAIGGWCPPGRESESGSIPEHFPLRETPEERSPAAPHVPRSLRTEWNVRDSDATLILRPAQGASEGASEDPGSEWAAECARRYGRALLVCDPVDPQAAARIVEWLRARRIETLGVGGPSEGTQPGIGEAVYALLVDVFSSLGAK